VVQKSFSIGVYHFQGGCDNCYDNGGKIENLLFLAAVQNSFYKIHGNTNNIMIRAYNILYTKYLYMKHIYSLYFFRKLKGKLQKDSTQISLQLATSSNSNERQDHDDKAFQRE